MNRVLAVIPARGGSRGVARKNLRAVGGIPLIVHALNSANRSKLISRCIVSTEDEEIAEVARKNNGDVPFMRPTELATDTASSVATLIHAVDYCEQQERRSYEIAVLLQPTTPFRTADDIDGTVQLLLDRVNRNTAITVAASDNCNPNYLYRQVGSESSIMQPLLDASATGQRRQDMEKYYVRTGAVYAVRVPFLNRHKTVIESRCLAYVTPSEHAINIDTELQLFIAEQIWTFRRKSLDCLG